MCSSKLTIKTFGSTSHNSRSEYKDVIFAMRINYLKSILITFGCFE